MPLWSELSDQISRIIQYNELVDDMLLLVKEDVQVESLEQLTLLLQRKRPLYQTALATDGAAIIESGYPVSLAILGTCWQPLIKLLLCSPFDPA